jgi:hypothetical protein
VLLVLVLLVPLAHPRAWAGRTLVLLRHLLPGQLRLAPDPERPAWAA